jgi:hypothetical protein
MQHGGHAAIMGRVGWMSCRHFRPPRLLSPFLCLGNPLKALSEPTFRQGCASTTQPWGCFRQTTLTMGRPSSARSATVRPTIGADRADDGQGLPIPPQGWDAQQVPGWGAGEEPRLRPCGALFLQVRALRQATGREAT